MIADYNCFRRIKFVVQPTGIDFLEHTQGQTPTKEILVMLRSDVL